MNMILHGIPDADLRNDDTLASPRHLEGGELMRFDRVITNPPFSQNYSVDGLPFQERFVYGMCPEKGKKADLMFVQHMVAVLRAAGMCCTVMPHGVLFRGGAEKAIRQGFIEDDLLDAVIGLAPNLFYGTGIPACILVLRAKGSKPADRKGKVLFINADAEFRTGRAQNYLDPEHAEKIVNAFEQYKNIRGFAAVVPRATLAENDYNLNIRRYADNAPPQEPHDVRAHLLGGVPRAEVEEKAGLFEAHNFDPSSLLVERDDHYFDFHPDLTDKRDIKAHIEASKGVEERESELSGALDAWWEAMAYRIEALPEGHDLMAVRRDYLNSFEESLVPVDLLDRFQVTGALASWWNEARFDLQTLMARGFAGVVEGWVTTIVTGIEEDNTKTDPLDHNLVKRLLPEYLEEIAEVEGQVAEVDGTIKAAEASSGEDQDDEDAEQLTAAEIKELKKQRTAGKKKLKKLRVDFVVRLKEARAGLDDEECQGLVLDLLRGDLEMEVEQYVTAHCQTVVAAVETWWDKYRVTLRDIEGERDGAKAILDRFLGDLGYV